MRGRETEREGRGREREKEGKQGDAEREMRERGRREQGINGKNKIS